MVTLTAQRFGANGASLSWTADLSPGVVGYRVHYGNFHGIYPNGQDAGNATNGTVNGLSTGYNWFFAVASYTSSVENPLSNEALVAVPSPVPTSKTVFQVPAASRFTVLGTLQTPNRGPLPTLNAGTLVVSAQRVQNDASTTLWTKVVPHPDLTVPQGAEGFLQTSFNPADFAGANGSFFVSVTASDPVTHLAWPVGAYQIKLT
jgi:hypothetical protein